MYTSIITQLNEHVALFEALADNACNAYGYCIIFCSRNEYVVRLLYSEHLNVMHVQVGASHEIDVSMVLCQ